MSSKGFTFIELLVVIVVLGIMTGLAVPNLRKIYDNFELENRVKDTYYLIKYLQASAVEDQRVYSLTIDEEKNEITSGFYDSSEYKPNLETSKTKVVFPLSTEITLAPAENKVIYFYPDARVDNLILTFSNRNGKKISLNLKGIIGDVSVKEE